MYIYIYICVYGLDACVSVCMSVCMYAWRVCKYEFVMRSPWHCHDGGGTAAGLRPGSAAAYAGRAMWPGGPHSRFRVLGVLGLRV